MKKLLLFLLSSSLFFASYGQSNDVPFPNAKHTYREGACKLSGAPMAKGISESHGCQACANDDHLNRKSKQKEDARVAQAKALRYKAEQEQKIRDAENKEKERIEKLRIAAEIKKRELERDQAEREIKNKIAAQLRKINDAKLAQGGGAPNLDLKNIYVKQTNDEFILQYEETPVKRFSKKSYFMVDKIEGTNYFYVTQPDKYVPFMIPDRSYPRKVFIRSIIDVVGNELPGFSDVNGIHINNNANVIFFYKFLGSPSHLRETSSLGNYEHVYGFYKTESEAREAVKNYDPREGWAMSVHFFIVKTKAIVTDFNLKVLREEQGYVIHRDF